MPKFTPRQIDLLNIDPLATAHFGTLEFKLIQRGDGEWVAGTIRNTHDLGREVLDVTFTTDQGTAKHMWLDQIRQQAEQQEALLLSAP